MKLIPLLLITLWFCPVSMARDLPDDTRMEWWREARFGMFIHWGLYSIPAGTWQEKTTHGEWIRQTAQIPMEVYDQIINEFNPVTTLRYDLAEDAMVNIIIHDMLGRQVKTLINRTQDAGYKSVIWNATNDYGKPVSAGIYLYQIQAVEYISTKKMVLLK